GKEPDPDHPFGHGRFEYISGFVVSLAILLIGFELLKSSIGKILHPQAVDTSTLAMGILLVSIAVKLYMAFYNHTVGKKIDSAAMEATAADSLSDSVATAVVFIAMLVMRFAGINIDGICGVLVALFILYAGISAAKDTLNPLLGLAPDKEFVQQIEEIVTAHEEVTGMHDLVVHDYGPGRCMISLHAEVPGDENIFDLHDAIDRIERELHEKLGCEAVIHMDPVETNNAEITRMKEIVAKTVKQIDPKISIHDFRMVSGPTHTNLIFDAVVPFELRMSKEEVQQNIEHLVEELDGNYFAVVQIDQSYV
ncbi:MAG: cation diffusion facilitator family transporter, partial [Lachnospiraceae bacterium]|nr:cation diffusion facilitator family transporter [Lachnospiraceae bacterium]